ncbi:universal stress protein UspF [Morganella morganii subsp. morganii]|uniref:universal stress protein UspF n=1 Tax=Morganella morganii TaxID=582 RepID=UPI001BD9B4CA|nr:universal stress protein UspF [Morganella morganii]MBT0369598.1 universal stress protein UspF [Morganella morganii subsp. morganii]
MYKTIIVPIDISETGLTREVIPTIQTLAKFENAKIHFIAVIPSFSHFASFGIAYAATLPEKDEILDSAKEQLAKMVSDFNLPVEQFELHVVSGSPKDQILKLADTLESDLIVISSRRPDMSTYLLGSNAAAVVRYAHTSVLVVR